MNVEVVARGSDVDKRLRTYVDKKIEKLGRFFDDIQSVRVVFKKEKVNRRVELNITDRHGNHSVGETTDDFRSAFDLAMDKLETKGRKAKEILKEGRRRQAPNRGHAATSWQVDVIDRVSLAESETPQVVKRTQLPIELMSVEDAAINLDRSKNEFIVFRNDSNDRVSVLYRRRDNNFGLIEPEF